ncbi:hypothetical protein [Arthrobacter sp. NEB 688]|uniref:hypothetical protein n=1 Tax=Arthrobacter sp. NEB 688 TaxID=904039 RepID=UPI0015675F2E|nr:hypothetical protein [Arthrobacter sp. NEB 688]QKE85499.1 hypothetical protein HL663_17250 [Arthrobacter sp. NEB 688]
MSTPTAAVAPSTARSSRPLPRDAAGPVADALVLVVLLLACGVVVATAADLLGLRPFVSRGPAVGATLVVLAPVLAVAAHLRRARAGDRPAGRTGRRGEVGRALLVAAPALLLVAVLVWSLSLPTAQRLEWFIGGDHVRHVVLVADERARGALDYSQRNYPRAWHTTVALGWSLTGPPSGRADLVGLLGLMSALVWMLSAALALATSSLTSAAARRVRLGPWTAAAAAAAAGAATLWPAFLANYQALGFEGSLTAALVVAVALREVLVRPASLVASLTAWAGLLVMANTWQLLLPVSGLLALAATVARVRAAGPGGRRRRLAEAAALVSVTALSSVPAMTAVVGTVGVGHAVVADVEAPVPLWLLGVGLAALGVLAARYRHDRGMLLVLAVSVLPALTALGLAVRLGIPVTRYYPAKLLWHTTVLGLAWTAVVAGGAWAGAGARALPGLLGRAVLGTAAGAVALGAVVTPLGAFSREWSTVDAATVLRLLEVPGAERAQVVWSSGPLVTDAATRILLDGYRPEAGRVDTPQGGLTVAQECDLLRAATDPTVLSDHPQDEVRARYACVAGLTVLGPGAG